MFVIATLPREKLLKYRASATSLNIFASLVKYSRSDVIWTFLKKVLPEEEEDLERLKNDYSSLIEKDINGLSIIDYAFVKQKHSVLEYVKSISMKIDGHEVEFPNLYMTFLKETPKSSAKIAKDKDDLLEMDILAGIAEKYHKTGAKSGTILPSPLEVNHYSVKLSNDVTYLDKMIAIGSAMRNAFPNATDKFSISEFKFPYKYVSTKEQLIEMRDHIERHPIFTVDVEFTSPIPQEDKEQHHKIHKIAASMQFAVLDQAFFIDCLELQQWINPIIGDLLESWQFIKVFHSCEGDINVIYQSFGIIVRNIFDTSKAHRTIETYKDSISLFDLVRKTLGFGVDKSFQVAAWNMRPLMKPMLDYAVSDAVLLIPLFGELLKLARGKELEIWGKSNIVGKWAKPLDYEVTFIRSNS